jgi:hypothetical protein
MLRTLATASVTPLLVLASCSQAVSAGEPDPSGTSATLDPSQSQHASEPAKEQKASSRGGFSLPSDGEQLRTDGFLELRLGMSPRAALETGRITIGRTANGCTEFYLARYGDGSGLGAHGYFSAERGLAVIHAQGEMHTPEGVALGTPVARLQGVYPALRRSGGLMTVRVSDRADYFFVGRNDTVNYFGLSLPHERCLAATFDQPEAARSSALGPASSSMTAPLVHRPLHND